MPSGSDEWVELYDAANSKTYCWNRHSHRSVWTAPACVEVVWVGAQGGGVRYQWHRVTHASLPLLLLEARVVLASAVFLQVLFVEGDMECVWFLLVAGERAWCWRVLVRSSW